MSTRGDGQKPDVSNLIREQAHAPLPLPAGHARMPPGLPKRVTEFSDWGYYAPLPGFHEERRHIARVAHGIKWNVAGSKIGHS